MARFLEVSSPWGGVFSVNVEHICAVIADQYSDGKAVKQTVVISLLGGDRRTADIPYEEFMRLLIPTSLSGLNKRINMDYGDH